MILNIRGPSGAGKSWVMRQILDLTGIREEVYAADQRTIEGYWLRSRDPAFVVGPYAVPTGGADALRGGWSQIGDILLRYASWGPHVLLEGIRINSGHSNLIELVRKNSLPLEVIFLNTPEEECFQNILRRREMVRNRRDPYQIRHWVRDHIRRNERQMKHFSEAGIPTATMTTYEAADKILHLLGNY